MTLAIECRGLTMSYGALRVLHGVDLEIEVGSVGGLLGSAGAGKSTLLKILATTMAPVAGTFSVAGVPGDRPHEIRRHVGVLLENSGLPERHTGLDVLIQHARLYGEAGASARATAGRLLAQVGLSDSAGRPVTSYSPGMRQRLRIARAVIGGPGVLLLDDPMAGLDLADRRRIRALITALARERGTTVLLSSRSLADLEGLCDRVVALEQGHLVADGSGHELGWRDRQPA